MSDFDFLRKDDLYFRYFRLGSNSYFDKVRFFNNHKNDLQYLEDHRIHDIKLDYILCLFEVGRYNRFLKEVDPIIEMVIQENIFDYNGENIFNLLLKKKAFCFINLKHYPEAISLLKQLMRLEPDNRNIPFYFYLCNRKLTTGREEIIKGVAIVSLLCGLSFKFAETFVVDPFFSHYLSTFSSVTTTFFVTGVVLLIFNEYYRRWEIGRQIKNIQKESSPL